MFEQGLIKARDFSAYYVGAWRLLYNPQYVYYHGGLPSDYQVNAIPDTFKYLPFFLLFILPLLTLSYQSALIFFNVLQFLMLPLMGWFIYKTLASRKKSVLIIAAVLIIALIEPFAYPQTPFLSYRLTEIKDFIKTGSLSVLRDGFSNSYYYQWIDGESKVLQTFLILLSAFFSIRTSRLSRIGSGIAFSLSSFDPRPTLLALPIIFMFNRSTKNLTRFFFSAALTFVITNVPLMLYANIAQQFIHEVFIGGPLIFYAYEWIPVYTVIAFTLANYDIFLKGVRTRIKTAPNGSST